MGPDPQPASRALRRRTLLAIGLAVAALACGKRGDPLPPLRPTPQPVTGLALSQHGNELTIEFVAPRQSTDGARLPVLDIELLRLDGEGDFGKTAKVEVRKAAPGERLRFTETLPPVGTWIRVAVRAVQRKKTSVQTPVASLTVQAPPPVPTELVARPGAVGLRLAWSAPDPMPCWVVPTPAPSPSPGAGPAGSRPSLFTNAPAPPTASTPAALPGAPPSAPSAPTAAMPPPSPAPTPLPTAPAATPSAAVGLPSATASPAPTPTPTPVPMPPRVGGFRVYRRADPGSYGLALDPIPTENSTYDDTTAALGSHVCYVVRTVVSTDPVVESDASNEVCLTVEDVTAPAPPSGLTTLPGDGGLEVSWSPSIEPDLASYRIYRAQRGERPARVGEVAKPATSFRDGSAVAGQRYRYTVTAVDAAGNESPPSAASEASP